MNKTILLTGGNMGDRLANLLQAKILLEKNGILVKEQSKIYETAAWGNTNQPGFLNQVLIAKTILTPVALLQTILNIELQMGRQRFKKYGPRIIDIDILFYNNEVLHTPDLVIPHPQIGNRRFVLVPLNEIAGNWVHPFEKKTVSQLLHDCADQLDVTVFNK